MITINQLFLKIQQILLKPVPVNINFGWIKKGDIIAPVCSHNLLLNNIIRNHDKNR